MTGKRQIFILLLIAIFVMGVYFVDKFVRPEEGSTSGEGDTETIRGVVTTLLPSGQVIAVQKEDGAEAILSLSGVSTITNELGEELFYSDVKPGMPISAAGIKDIKEGVLVPSLVTVQSSYAYKGVLVARIPSVTPKYFSLRYKESAWKLSDGKRLAHAAADGCVLTVSESVPQIGSDWVKSVTERRLGGNIFDDARYTLKGEQKLRVITLEDPGEKYGAVGEHSIIGPYTFAVTYEKELSSAALTECLRDVDTVVSSFLVRNASQNILVLSPESPAFVRAGGAFSVEGRVRSYDGSVNATVIDESGKKLVSKRMTVKTREGEQYGIFKDDFVIPRSAPTKLKLRVFQYSPASGAPIDIVELPLVLQ